MTAAQLLFQYNYYDKQRDGKATMSDILNLAQPLIVLIAGAILGVIADETFHSLKRRRLRKNPIAVSTRRSEVYPLWFATSLPPPPHGQTDRFFDEHVMSEEPFCGFAKLNLEITNTSQDIVYITDMRIKKSRIDLPYHSRVRFITQGDCTVTRLYALMDDAEPILSTDLNNRYDISGRFFERGDRIKIAPAETERIYLVLITINDSWRFNLSITYSINNEERQLNNVLEHGELIAPYQPEKLKRDYCSFLEMVNPDYEEFEDAKYFTADQRDSHFSQEGGDPSMSPVEYLQCITDALTMLLGNRCGSRFRKKESTGGCAPIGKAR